MPAPTDYETIASRYAAGIDARPWNALYERPSTLALLPDVHGLDVLDAGCGSGWYAEWLVNHGARVVGIDRSPSMVRLAAERLGDRARVLEADVSDLSPELAEQTFDLILSSLVLHYLEDLPATFRAWARLLRPGGIIVFSTHHPIQPGYLLEPGYLVAELIEEDWPWLGETMCYYRRPLRDLTEPLAAAGLVIERISEPTPGEDFKAAAPNGWNRLSRLPAFIFFRARKPPL